MSQPGKAQPTPILSPETQTIHQPKLQPDQIVTQRIHLVPPPGVPSRAVQPVPGSRPVPHLARPEPRPGTKLLLLQFPHCPDQALATAPRRAEPKFSPEPISSSSVAMLGTAALSPVALWIAHALLSHLHLL